MDIETKIALGFLIAFLAGLFIGWYVTCQKYEQEEEKRKAVANAINHERLKTPPNGRWEVFVDVLSKLNLPGVDEYRIVYDDCVYSKTLLEEPKTEEEQQ